LIRFRIEIGLNRRPLIHESRESGETQSCTVAARRVGWDLGSPKVFMAERVP